MSHNLEETLRADLALWAERGLARTLPSGVPEGVDFTSNDYLGLARDPRIIAASRVALEEGGTGGRASRLLGGGDRHHREAEAAAAAWLGAEAALLFPSGYQANLALVSALAGPADTIVSDALNHASLIDAARLSRARVAVHRHGDLDDVERALFAARGARRRLVLTEGVFSMDGDRADLAGLARLCERHDAWLVVDEAHAIGLLGAEGAGAWAAVEGGLAAGTRARLAARMVACGKALGAAGGFAVGSRAVVDTLVQGARGFVFSTAPPPAFAAALTQSIRIVRAADTLRERCLQHARRIAYELGSPAPASAIVPWVLGAPEVALAAAAALAELGLDVRAVRPPTVPPGTSRLRIVAHANHTVTQVDHLISACRGLATTVRGVPAATEPKLHAARGRALVVVGTDTGIGKTVASALLLCALRAHGPAAYWKPVQTGSESDTDAVGELASASGAELLKPLAEFALPASPHTAAAAEGRTVPVCALTPHLDAWLAANRGRRLVIELAGGLLVPYDGTVTQADWLAEWRPRVLLVARAGLGTLNHTLLTAEALCARGITPFALLLVGLPHPSNHATLAARLGLPVLELPHVEDVRAALAPGGAWQGRMHALGDLAANAAPLEEL